MHRKLRIARLVVHAGIRQLEVGHTSLAVAEDRILPAHLHIQIVGVGSLDCILDCSFGLEEDMVVDAGVEDNILRRVRQEPGRNN